jgi:hypothetical protein
MWSSLHLQGAKLICCLSRALLQLTAPQLTAQLVGLGNRQPATRNRQSMADTITATTPHAAVGNAARMLRPRRCSPGARPKPIPPSAPRRAIRPLLLLVALVNLAWSLYQLPVSRVVESRLCRQHYAVRDPSVLRPDGSVPEELCKIDEVQQQLGWIQGITEASWVAGGRSLADMSMSSWP